MRTLTDDIVVAPASAARVSIVSARRDPPENALEAPGLLNDSAAIDCAFDECKP